jgi:hypothetical protein
MHHTLQQTLNERGNAAARTEYGVHEMMKEASIAVESVSPYLGT